MEQNGQSMILLFFGVFLLAMLSVVFYNWLYMDSLRFLGRLGVPFLASILSILLWWIATGAGFLGFYWMGRKLELDFTANLRVPMLAIFGGAYVGSIVGLGGLLIAVSAEGSLSTILWLLSSPWFLPIFFLAFTVLGLAHFKFQWFSFFQFVRDQRRRRIETKSKEYQMIPLFLIVFSLGIIKEVLGYGVPLSLLLRDSLQHQRVVILFWIISWLAPMLVFFGLYGAGKKLKIDLKAHLYPVILPLLVGAYIGSSIGRVVSELIIIPSETSGSDILWLLGSPWFLQLFFIAFTAVSLTHLKSQEFSCSSPPFRKTRV